MNYLQFLVLLFISGKISARSLDIRGEEKWNCPTGSVCANASQCLLPVKNSQAESLFCGSVEDDKSKVCCLSVINPSEVSKDNVRVKRTTEIPTIPPYEEDEEPQVETYEFEGDERTYEYLEGDYEYPYAEGDEIYNPGKPTTESAPISDGEYDEVYSAGGQAPTTQELEKVDPLPGYSESYPIHETDYNEKYPSEYVAEEYSYNGPENYPYGGTTYPGVYEEEYGVCTENCGDYEEPVESTYTDNTPSAPSSSPAPSDSGSNSYKIPITKYPYPNKRPHKYGYHSRPTHKRPSYSSTTSYSKHPSYKSPTTPYITHHYHKQHKVVTPSYSNSPKPYTPSSSPSSKPTPPKNSYPSHSATPQNYNPTPPRGHTTSHGPRYKRDN